MNPSSPRTVCTAAAAGLARCASCGLLSRLPGAGDGPRPPAACPRCGAALHRRRPASVARTWAYGSAAAILYVPANVLPVMQSGSLFGVQDDTIWSGVVFLWHDGSWFLAALVFLASLVVPLAKLLALGFLLLGLHWHPRWRPQLRAHVYRTIEFLGRWSMLDIYVVTLLAGLVQLQTLATVRAGPGAVAFGAVVVLTMLASQSFDPRLIWDAAAGPAARSLPETAAAAR